MTDSKRLCALTYLDPPYGIKFASNFQPQFGQRDVKDREQELTREPEMVKAYLACPVVTDTCYR